MLDVAGTNFARLGHNSASGTDLLDVRSEGHTRFLTNGNNERLRIASNGSVGINTTLTSGALTVNIAGDYKTSTQNVADEGLIFQSFTTASTGDVYPGISWTGNPGALGRARAAITAIATNDNAGSDLVFLTRNQADGTELDVTDDEKLRIKSNGNIGIGTDTPGAILEVFDATSNTILNVKSGDSGASLNLIDDSARSSIEQNGTTLKISSDTGAEDANSDIRLQVDGSTKVLIDSNGKMLVGNTSARANLNDGSDSAHIQLEGTTQDTSTLSVVRNSNNDGPAHLVLGKSRGGSVNSTTVLNNGDTIGQINFEGADGTHLIRGAEIRAQTVSGVGANDMPTNLEFRTNGGSTSVTTRMTLLSGGGLTFNGDTAAANALADYEEGTFTPTINTGFTASYNSQAGRYTKVGNVVHFFISIDLSSLSGSSSDTYAEVEGLPFTATTTGNIDNAVTVAWQYQLGNNVYHAYIEQGGTHIVLLGEPSGGSRTHWNPAQVWDDADARIALSGTYTTTA